MDKDRSKQIRNLFYGVAALGIFNVIVQFILYPAFERQLGSEQYGVALSAISFCAIIASTCGCAINYVRLLGVEKKWTNNGDYNLILLIMCVVGSLIGALYLVSLDLASPLMICLYILLICTTMLRYYSDVEFRIKTDFFQYMIYYVLISVGYILGIFVFRVTGLWMLAVILGESAAILYVVFRGTLYRPPFFKKSEHFRPILSGIGFLFVSTLFEHIALHSDRILLLAITGDGSAVTTYYVASLVGKVISMLTVPINALIVSYLAKYKGGLVGKLWSVASLVALVFGGVAFLGCFIVSPWLIGLLYPDTLSQALELLFPAILGQILYFVSGVLVMFLLRFTGEKQQFFFNTGYVVEFLLCVGLGTVLYGLEGFVWSIVFANALRFVAVILWGYLASVKKSWQLPLPEETPEEP